MPDSKPGPRWLTWLLLAFLIALGSVADVARRIDDVFDKWLCQCEPDERFGTWVWHTHTFRFLRWRWRWLAYHLVLEDGTDYREIIPWTEMHASDVQVRVYPGLSIDVTAIIEEI